MRKPREHLHRRETLGKRPPNGTILHRQRGSRTPDQVLRKERGVNTAKNNWAFFSNNLPDQESQLSSERQPYFGGRPESPHEFLCEQRPKKDRWQKLACPDSRGQLIKLITTSERASGPGSSPETSIEKLWIENEDLSLPIESTDSTTEMETSVFASCSLKLDTPKSALHATENKKRRQKRIFDLAPNFNLLGQSHISVKGRTVACSRKAMD